MWPIKCGSQPEMRTKNLEFVENPSIKKKKKKMYWRNVFDKMTMKYPWCSEAAQGDVDPKTLLKADCIQAKHLLGPKVILVMFKIFFTALDLLLFVVQYQKWKVTVEYTVY